MAHAALLLHVDFKDGTSRDNLIKAVQDVVLIDLDTENGFSECLYSVTLDMDSALEYDPKQDGVPAVQVVTNQDKPSRWVCEECGKTLSVEDWTYSDLAERGTPVCACDADMKWEANQWD